MSAPSWGLTVPGTGRLESLPYELKASLRYLTRRDKLAEHTALLHLGGIDAKSAMPLGHCPKGGHGMLARRLTQRASSG